jgi:hypothetical protein
MNAEVSQVSSPTIVGIGASASGIEALREFFSAVPTDLGVSLYRRGALRSRSRKRSALSTISSSSGNSGRRFASKVQRGTAWTGGLFRMTYTSYFAIMTLKPYIEVMP